MSHNGRNMPTDRKRGKWLRKLLAAIVIIILLIGGFLAYEYYRLQPANHFRNLPTVGGTGSASTTIGTGQSAKVAAGVLNILLVGSDARPGETAGHADSIMIVHANLNTHQYNVMSIPRDTRVHFDNYGYTKLTSVQYVGQADNGTKSGIEDLVKSVTELTGIPINYYAETNYWGLKDMVDAIGGIDMYVPFNVTLTHPWYPQDQGKQISKGTHFFDGNMVTEVVHERDSVPGTDYGRQRLQEEAVAGILKTVLKPSNLPKLPKLNRELPKFLIATNMSRTDALSLALAMKNFKSSDVHYYQIPETGAVMYDDVLKANNDQLVVDQNGLAQIVKDHFSS